MSKKISTLVVLDPKQGLPPLLTFVFTIIYICGLFVHTSLAHADPAPGGNVADPVVRAVDLAKPAVVRIITSLDGRLTVHFPSTSKPTATFPQNGSSYKLAFSGSGAFISAHGDILTADHVVNTANDPSLDQYLQQLAAQDIADYINQNFDTTTSGLFSANNVIASLSDGTLRSDTQYGKPSSEVYLSTDYSGFINAANLQTLPVGMHASVDKIERESSFTQKDLAIIHANIDNTPFIKLGDSTNVAQQDELTIIGFPGNGDVSTRKEPNDVLTSSVNKIYVSALKKTDAGINVIQVGGNIEHGDSGGPALDRNGNIVGIVSFGLENSQPEGTTFLQASKGVQDLLQTLTVDTTPGTFQKTWSRAFADYTSTAPGHWHKAATEFGQLSQNFSRFQAVTPYLNYVTAQANHEKVPQITTNSPPDYTGLIEGVAIAIMIILILLFVLLFFLLRKKKPARVNPSTPAIAYAASPTYSPYAYEQTSPQPPAQSATYAAVAQSEQRPIVSPTPVQQMPPLREYGQAPGQTVPTYVPIPQRYVNGQAPAQPVVWPQYPPPYYSNGRTPVAAQPYPTSATSIQVPPTRGSDQQLEQTRISMQEEKTSRTIPTEIQADETAATLPENEVQDFETFHAEDVDNTPTGKLAKVTVNQQPEQHQKDF